MNQEKNKPKTKKKMSEFEHVYYAPPDLTDYAGARRLKRVTSKRKQAALTQWFESQDAYTLHKPLWRKFPRRYNNVAMVKDC